MTHVRYYADVNHVAEAVDKLMDEVALTQEGSVCVYESDCVMRGITPEEARERNLMDAGDPVCNFTYDGTRLKLGFHESKTEGTFKLRPAGRGAIAPKQASRPEQIAPALEPVIREIELNFDVISWDFTEVSAASIATGGYFSDFEFEYVVTGP